MNCFLPISYLMVVSNITFHLVYAVKWQNFTAKIADKVKSKDTANII